MDTVPSKETASKAAANSVADHTRGIIPYRFQPGQSGNPNGRPKKQIQVMKTAEDHIDAAIDVLVEALKDESVKNRIAAANALLDRGLGKPKQSVEVSTPNRSLDEIATDDLIAAVQQSADRDGTTETETID
jgi:uncharacterized protein (UPF0147 family)